jgi:putative nucleotidyltransferase with HDIG domain
MISDAPMTTRILRVANTSYYRGNREKVTDANEAIGTLGFEKIRNVVLTTSVFKMFSGPSAAEKFSLEGLWKHCLGVASASRSIARYLGKSWHETAYTCGLLHDIGKVARFKLDEDDGTSVFINDSQTSLDKKISLIQAELINQSPRHDYLGYLICKNWGLSKLVEGVVRWHHEPNLENRQRIASEETNELIDLVMLANWVVNEKGFGFSGHEQPEKPSDALLNRLNIHPAHLEHVSATVDNELELTEDFCKMLDDV